jgi:hypothetical protein
MKEQKKLITRRESLQFGLGLAAWLASQGKLTAETPAHSAPIKFTEHLVWDKFTYGFGIQALDLDGDGFIDLTALGRRRGHRPFRPSQQQPVLV